MSMQRTSVLVLALLVAACGSRVDEEVAVDGGYSVSMSPESPAEGFQTLSAPDTRPAEAAQDADVAMPKVVIRTGNAEIEVPSVPNAIEEVMALAARLGASVGSSTRITARGREEATIALRVPSARFDEALAALESIGDVQVVNSNSEDVTEEYVDVEARLGNARRLEQRLLALLDRSGARLEEIIAVERELARVREQIERQEGRLRYLRSRADVSTLIVTVHEPESFLSNRQGSVFRTALRDAVRNFVRLVAGFIAALGVLLPLAAAAALAWWLIRRRRRPPAAQS